MNHPIGELTVDQIAERLSALFSGEALPLALERSNEFALVTIHIPAIRRVICVDSSGGVTVVGVDADPQKKTNNTMRVAADGWQELSKMFVTETMPWEAPRRARQLIRQMSTGNVFEFDGQVVSAAVRSRVGDASPVDRAFSIFSLEGDARARGIPISRFFGQTPSPAETPVIARDALVVTSP